MSIEEHAPMFLQEYILEGLGIRANSLSTKEFAFELISHIIEVEEFILAHDVDNEGVLEMMDDRPTQSSRTSPKTLTGLRKHISFFGGNLSKIRISIHLPFYFF